MYWCYTIHGDVHTVQVPKSVGPCQVIFKWTILQLEHVCKHGVKRGHSLAESAISLPTAMGTCNAHGLHKGAGNFFF